MGREIHAQDRRIQTQVELSKLSATCINMILNVACVEYNEHVIIATHSHLEEIFLVNCDTAILVGGSLYARTLAI